MDINQFYTGRIEDIRQRVLLLQNRKKQLGAGRLIAFIGAVVFFFALLDYNEITATLTAIALLVIFLIIAVRDIDNTKKLNFQKTLLQINEEEFKALHHDYSSFGHGGSFFPPNHPYANDLDIFGPHGLFQFLNRTSAAPGSRKLADWLLDAAPRATILERQEAVKELSEAIDWRQKLQATGKISRISEEVFHQINYWVKEKTDTNPKKSVLNVLVILFPLITLTFIILANFDLLPWTILWLSFCAHLLLLWRVDKKVSPAYESLSKSVTALDAFYETLKQAIAKPFASSLVNQLQQQCYKVETPAYELLNVLKRILHRMHLRLNPLVHFPLNLVIFWDWYQYRQLFKWKRQHKESLLIWINACAELEALSSLANMAFNHPRWRTPKIEEKHFFFSAAALGHPLIADDKRISNDITLDSAGKIMLVTGSNMAGKSTFLRTTGINMILAMAGANVCAEAMNISEIKVISSMRVADNLEENISTFYAELKKLEIILQRVRAHEKVFILLDEILRGTNSQDRHAGSRALIKQFLAEKAVGILATHDLALTEMESEHPGQIMNYHFDVQVKNEELYFDYKLKPGICTSMNASLLMRKIGINV